MGLLEIVAHVFVADVDECWLHDHTRYLQSLRTEAVKVVFAARNNSGEECGDGSRLLHLPACGLLLVLPVLNWTNLDASGGHCAARQRGSWEVFVNPLMAWMQLCDHVRAKGLQARMLYSGSGRATVA